MRRSSWKVWTFFFYYFERLFIGGVWVPVSNGDFSSCDLFLYFLIDFLFCLGFGYWHPSAEFSSPNTSVDIFRGKKKKVWGKAIKLNHNFLILLL